MSEDIETFLEGTPFAKWRMQDIAGDASSRSYSRLFGPSDKTAILMNASHSPHGETEKFIHIAKSLREAGLAAPEILAFDTHKKWIILEDLGVTDVASAVEDAVVRPLDCYSAIGGVLIQLCDVHIPNLPTMDAANFAKLLEPLGLHYGPNPIEIGCIQEEIQSCYDQLGLMPDTLALRDFHAENLIWRSGEYGTDRVGLLDFQDALYAPAGYDLASLTRDARRDVSPEITAALTSKLATFLERDHFVFSAQVALIAVQRNLRILGVFAKLVKHDKKPSYGKFVPRVWQHISKDLEHPALQDLRASVQRKIPAPTPTFIEGWSQ